VIMDNVEEVDGRLNRKLNDELYMKGTQVRSLRTGHPVSICGSHKYQDIITREFYRTPMTKEDYEEEERNKERAIRNGFSVYKICNARLPINVEGYGYKELDSDRMYVLRNFHKRVYDKYYGVNNEALLVSINADNYGYVEKFYSGKPINGIFVEAFKDRYIDLERAHGGDKEFGWDR